MKLLTLVTALILASQLGLAQANLQPGQRVQVDVIMASSPERSIWKSGTVTRIEGGSAIITVDDGRVMTIPLSGGDWIHSGGAPQPAPTSNQPSPPAVPNQPASPPPVRRQHPALGAPPDGVYDCEKISGSALIALGKLEIRGGTYRGMAGGSFAPLTVGAGGTLTFSAGLTGMPRGTQLNGGKYIGNDHQGHPLIQIFYRNASGSKEQIDAVLRN